MADISDVFSRRLRQLRDEAHLTQTELGKLLGSGKVQVSRYETGVILPNATTLVRLADTFDCSVDYLLGRSNTRKGVGRQDKRYSPEERLIIDAIREKRYSRLMHMIALLIGAEEEREAQSRAEPSVMDDNLAKGRFTASVQEPLPFLISGADDRSWSGESIFVSVPDPEDAMGASDDPAPF